MKTRNRITSLNTTELHLPKGFKNLLIFEFILGKGNLITSIHHYIKKQINMKCCTLREQHEAKKQKNLT